jgi:hypothetical protein
MDRRRDALITKKSAWSWEMHARLRRGAGWLAIDLHGEDRQNTKGLSISPFSSRAAYVQGTSGGRLCANIWLARSILAYCDDSDGKGTSESQLYSSIRNRLQSELYVFIIGREPICEIYTFITQRTFVRITLFSLMNQAAISGLDLDGLGGLLLALPQSKLPSSDVSGDIRYCQHIHRMELSLQVSSRDLQMAKCSRSL